MGCCCASRRKPDEIELLASTNDAVCCKSGLKGDNVTATQLPDACAYSISGSGTFIGSCCLDCDTAMWEVKVGKNPEGLRIGLKKYQKKTTADFNKFLDSEADSSSPNWFLSETPLKEGDVVGIYWDQTDLPMVAFSVNGEMVHYCVTRIRPSNDIFPAVSVKEGSTCEVIFSGKDFQFPPKSKKFQMIICASSLI